MSKQKIMAFLGIILSIIMLILLICSSNKWVPFIFEIEDIKSILLLLLISFGVIWFIGILVISIKILIED